MKNQINKYGIFIILILAIFSCKKQKTKNELVAEQLIGKWNTTSLKVDSVETFVPILSKITTTFFNLESNKCRYNLKISVLDSLISETEGNVEVISEGKKMTLDEDGNKEPTTVGIISISENSLKTRGFDTNNKEVLYIGTK